MDIDTALSKLGSFGRWQVTYYTVLSIIHYVHPAWHMLAVVWIAFRPDHHCKVPANSSTLEEWIPMEEDGQWSKCKMYVNSTISNQTTDCLHGWQYDLKDGPSIVSKWDLVCNRDFLAQTSQTVLVLGVMTGALGFTIISDHIGRKPVLFATHFLMVIVGVLVTVTNNYYVFLLLRFVTGALQQGILLSGFIMACELFSAKQRTFAGVVGEVVWAIAASVLPFIAMGFQNWTHLQLFISLTGLLVLPLYWWLPESVIWLYANDRIEEAEKIIKNAGKLNKIYFPETFLHHHTRVIKPRTRSRSTSKSEESESLHPKTDNSKHGTALQEDMVEERSFLDRLLCRKPQVKSSVVSVLKTKYSIIELFRNRTLGLYVLISALLWMIVTLVYYGLILSTSQLAGDRYMNGFYNALVEAPAYLSSYFVLQRFGRRKPLMVYFVIAGLPLFLTPFIPTHTSSGVSLNALSVIFYLIGKFGITGTFGIVFLYASELFPTNLRNQAVGICSLTGRVGNFIATYASYISERYPNVLSLIFGALSILSAILVLLLPETHNKPLPETIEEIEAWKKKPRKTTTNNDDRTMAEVISNPKP